MLVIRNKAVILGCDEYVKSLVAKCVIATFSALDKPP